MKNLHTLSTFLKMNLSILALITLASCGPVPEGAELMDEPFSESNIPKADLPPPTEALPQTGIVVDGNPPGQAPAPEAILEKYKYLDPSHMVPTDLLEKAVIYFEQNAAKIKNKNYLSVIDFAQSSMKRRFFMINMKTGAVWATTTAHGKGSDANHDSYAETFSNQSGSNASSLGYYLASETYTGSHGLSVRLDGLSSTNSNTRARAVVIHGASYVVDMSVKQGRSWGCPAVPMAYRDRIVALLKGGSLIYAERSQKR
jgi:hypothetical protein